MDKSQRMIERRLYLHDVHGRVGNPGWHRVVSDRGMFALALMAGTASFVILNVWVR